ncbi:hypothetical protein NEUTE1DRAFT_82913 [Neurospora tetrasperma FGSC 2508]|uniref:DUF221-domain-containing protein n=1 Tax=Neurospora tetrasperma (strain FGSC 2508 / ATCC MYA-4615 / P0657) TaxID=510951 RepID=F8MLW9_NEUT8|nr:uncharacterized protein NEUTE1DRAFT_82913 [Neurospora tetrasperma FGSC 2508]EGO58484.1 hypothetical protein NEUTE1DRAFT_82913 [Neurospora tetrasperma FGSC 2508]EGZ71178.1 DUF221-domain-containing protein [Neurospora tetrasperma FGSC 2509]
MEWLSEFHTHLWKRAAEELNKNIKFINESDDPRIGSGRDGASGGTLSHSSGDNKDSASLSALGSTFVPVLVYAAICLLIFFTFRRISTRTYAPRTIAQLREPEHPAQTLPNGWIDWVKPFWKIDDDYILNNCSLDGYLFLRFLKILSVICFAGLAISWPILLPINATGGNLQRQLDKLTMGNIKLPSKYYAHVVVAWLFFGFVLFMVCRECIYYINLRQAYLLSPNMSNRLSARTVLFTCIPKPYLDEAKLRKLFGDSVKNIWIPKNTNYLRGLVEDRDDVAERLEKAEIELIKKANTVRMKNIREGKGAPPFAGEPATDDPQSSKTSSFSLHQSNESAQDGDLEKGTKPNPVRIRERRTEAPPIPVDETETPGLPGEDPGAPKKSQADDLGPEYQHPYGYPASLPDVRGSVAALFVRANDRPHHRPLHNFGRRVDTIRWTRARLKVLNRDIWKLRRKFRAGDGHPLSSAFVEFDSQASAEAAYQILSHHQPMHMSPRYIGVRPEQVIWSSLRIRWWEQIMRQFLMLALVVVAIIFWSIPSAAVGIISNIDFLSEKVPFLFWIPLLPKVILGVIKGLLPAVALSMLMAIVPAGLRVCARVAGCPSHALVELYCQSAYFAFQVIQVFLVTTITSAASAAIIDVIKQPMSAPNLLAQNLPKASNFYLSYILVQCLGAGAGKLANMSDLLRHYVATSFMVDPRKAYHRWRKLTPIHWGAVYPRFTNMGVIALAYSCISPLILVFAGFGMLFVSLVYRYNLIYIHDDSELDTKGLLYPRALLHLMVGLYIAEICLIGLFALKKAFGPMLLMILFFGFCAITHYSLSSALSPLLASLPQTLALEKQHGQIAEDGDGDDHDINPVSQPTPSDPTSAQGGGGLAADYYNDTSMSTPGADIPAEVIGGSAADYYASNSFDYSDPSTDDPEPPGLYDDDFDSDGPQSQRMRGLEGSSSIRHSITEFAKTTLKSQLTNLKASANGTGPPGRLSPFTRFLYRIHRFLTPDPTIRNPNLIQRWLHPSVYADFRTLAKKVGNGPGPDGWELPKGYENKRGYYPPEMWKPAPRLWIPRDNGRVSRQEVRHNRDAGVWCTDVGCWLDDGVGEAPWEDGKDKRESTSSEDSEKGVEGESVKGAEAEPESKEGKAMDLEDRKKVNKKGIWKGVGKEAKKATGRVKPGRVRVRFNVEEGPMGEERWLF